MTSTDDILRQIDAATEDWETGPDVMRVNDPQQSLIPDIGPFSSSGELLAHFYIDRAGRIYCLNPRLLASGNRNTSIIGLINS